MSELGTKRICPGCGAKFYDLGKKPAVCLKCKRSFDPDAVSPVRKPRKRKEQGDVLPPKPKKRIIKAADDDEIDLSAFDDPESEDIAGGDEIESLDEIDELDDDLGTLTEVGEREREEDLLNSDDAEDDTFIEEMDSVETIIDRPDAEDEDALGRDEE